MISFTFAPAPRRYGRVVHVVHTAYAIARPVPQAPEHHGANEQLRLARRIRRRMALGMATAAIDGAVTVFLYLVLVLPPPKTGASTSQLARYVNAAVFVVYLAARGRHRHEMVGTPD